MIGRVRERRLARCRRDLLDPGMHEKSVRAIATRWGFANAPHFNRTFRETYGIPPGEYRQHWRAVSLRAAAS